MIVSKKEYSTNVHFELSDCMEYMSRFPDRFFDIAVVDPPYGIGESGKTNHTRSKLATSKDYKPFRGGRQRAARRGLFQRALSGVKESGDLRCEPLYRKFCKKFVLLDRMG